MERPYCQTSKRARLRAAFRARFDSVPGHDGSARGCYVRAACCAWSRQRPFKAMMLEAFENLGKGTRWDRHQTLAGHRDRRLQAGPFPLP